MSWVKAELFSVLWALYSHDDQIDDSIRFLVLLKAIGYRHTHQLILCCETTFQVAYVDNKYIERNWWAEMKAIGH